MFFVYHSNSLELHKDLFLKLIENNVENDPFSEETILVQSVGMERWLQIEIAQANGVAANLRFPMPATFIWQQYQENFNLPEQNAFSKDAMVWWLMGIIPEYLSHSAFISLANYLNTSAKSQYKLYQLAVKVSDLFDQYLVYRPEWINAWENNNDALISEDIMRQLRVKTPNMPLIEQIERDIHWQGILWRALVEHIRHSSPILHRAKLHEMYMQKLAQGELINLPKRLFIFGISTLPRAYLELLYAMGQQENCHVHLFFNNPTPHYWGDIDTQGAKFIKIDRTLFNPLPEMSSHGIHQDHYFATINEINEEENVNPLLANWGKLGRDFLHSLTELDDRSDIDVFVEPKPVNLLEHIKQHIYQLNNTNKNLFVLTENDDSLSIHSCHTPMREVEVLHDHLLHMFQLNPEITPKDVVVMIADIDKYTPYIQAVFGQYQRGKDKRHIPFSISDRQLSENDILVSSFLRLLNLKDSLFSAEEVLMLLDVPAIREKFQISLLDLPKIRYWVKYSGIRFGINKGEHNYNSWQQGIERILLGYALREESGVWENLVGFESSYGLQGQLAGLLAQFIEQLYEWQQVLLSEHSVEVWETHLNLLIDNFFVTDSDWNDTILILKDAVARVIEQIRNTHFNLLFCAEVIRDALTDALAQNDNGFKFMSGKVSFCTLVPMRSIPFKIVCLLGMNESDYPRQKIPNSFDLMQYHKQRCDRSRRDDDRYLFLEALLSAERQFYISYIGRSILDNQEQQPSVLVSQLLDYIADNVENRDSVAEFLLKQHTMTAFNEKNFMGEYRSFAYQWLMESKSSPFSEFIQPIQSVIAETRVIDFNQLKQFVINPVKYFFNTKLGVYFSEHDDLIEEYENFNLDKLECFQLKSALLACEEEYYPHFFHTLLVKGVLPRGYFAQITQQELTKNIAALQDKVRSFLGQNTQVQYFELTIELDNKSFMLTGDINHLYANNQRISWRAGSLRDKDIVEHWLYHLVICAVMDKPQPLQFYYQLKDEISCLSFEVMNKEAALEQLTVYLNSYLVGEQELQLLPTTDVTKYMALLDGEIDMVKCEQLLWKMADESKFNQENIAYWRRILMQSTGFNIEQINQTMKEWFQKMIEHRI